MVTAATWLNGGLAHAQGVHSLLDYFDEPLLDRLPVLAGWKIGELELDVRTALEVEAVVHVERPAAEAGRQPWHRPGQRVVVHHAVDVAGTVHEQRERQKDDDDGSDEPARYELQGYRSLTRSPAQFLQERLLNGCRR